MALTIGIAGVGHVGGALALTLAGAGRRVVVLPPRAGLPERLSHLETVPSARMLAEQADVVITCLRNSTETAGLLPELLAGAEGKSGFLHVDHCNGDPGRDREFAAAWEARGQMYIDAALLGPPERLPASKPRLIAGGSEAAVARLAEISAPYCDDLVHAGPAGSGHMLRLIIGLMGYGIAALSSEIIATARAAGIGPELLRAALSGKGSDSDTFQTMVNAAISPQAEVRRLPLSNVLRDLEQLAQLVPAQAPQDFMGLALRDFYGRAARANPSTMISQLPELLAGEAFKRAR